MKNTYTLLSILLIFISTTIFSQGQQELKLDTRVDNNGYWKEAAKRGLTKLNPVVTIAPATYTGSEIDAMSTTTENSPDVVIVEGNTSQSENSVFVNPADVDNAINSNNSTSSPGFGLTLYGANALHTYDGGQTWTDDLSGAGGNNQGDPVALVDNNGRIFIGFIKNDGQGIAYSDDNGTSWTNVQVANAPAGFGNLLDKNHMWIDNSTSSPYEGYLYNSWTTFGGSNDGEIGLSYSPDGGDTWNGPYHISNSLNAGSHNQGVNLATGPGGEAYALWAIYDSWPSDENALGFAKSYDGGATWEASRILENIRGIRNYGTGKDHRVNSFPCMAVDISGGAYNGNIYVVWANVGVPGINSGPDIDVYLIRSEDEGLTWSDPIRVNQDDPGLGNEHYFPWIACDPVTGTLSVVYYDDRNVSNNQAEVFCANSYDGGETWEDFKVSDVSFTPSPIPGLASGYMGDYLGIAAHGGKVYPVWTDNRTGVALTYTSPYQTSTLTAPTDLIAEVDQESGIVDLTWSHEPSPTFEYYRIYRGFSLIGTSEFPNYTDTLPDFGIYRYLVTAFYSTEGESGATSADAQWGNATIATDPGSIEEFLTPGSTSTRTIRIKNNGELPLEFTGLVSLPDPPPANPNLYCEARGNCGEFIARVQYLGIDKFSTCGEYTNNTHLYSTVATGQTFKVIVTNGDDAYPQDICGIWVDWNLNGNFNDDGNIQVNGSPGVGPYTANITVPEGAATGLTTMRVRLARGGALSGCGITPYGEVEDYSLSVIGWMGASPLEAEIDPGDSLDMVVSFDAANLDNGTYEAFIGLSTNDPENDTITIPVTLTVQDIALAVSADKDSICFGSSTRIYANVTGGTGNATYEWTSDPAGFASTEPDPVVMPEVSTTYFVEVTDGSVMLQDEITITVVPLPDIDLGADQEICEGSLQVFDAGPGFSSYFWSNGETGQSIEVAEAGLYWCEVSNDFGCAERDSVALAVNPLPLVNLGDDFSFCENEPATLDAGEGFFSYLWSTGEETRTIEVAEAGIFWVQVASEQGCLNYDTVIVETDPLPGVTEITDGPVEIDLYENSMSTYTSSEAENANTYNWEIDPVEAGTIEIDGLTANVTWDPEYTGNVLLTVTAQNDCGDGPVSAAFQVSVYNSLSIFEIEGINSMKVFPNPTTGMLTVQLMVDMDLKINLKITDMLGKVLRSDNLELKHGTQSRLISLEGLDKGVYNLLLESAEGKIERKIVLR